MAEPRNRTEGNPNQRAVPREAARMGSARAAEEIPAQGNVISCVKRARYRFGWPRRPHISFDNGFLDVFPRRAPTVSDRAKRALWRGKLEAGEAFRPDLTDALATYRHFLEGKGKARQFSYERYVMGDLSGQATLASAIVDIQVGILELWKNGGQPGNFMVTGDAIPCGATTEFPYPRTENWQKAIGGHAIWLSAVVAASVPTGTDPQFDMQMTLHAEDRYNFNPGQHDIATGIPDDANGIFEITGLAHQFDQTSTLVRRVLWEGRACGRIRSTLRPNPARERQPTGNRRARNRI